MKGRGHERKGGRHDETDRDGSRGDIELAVNDRYVLRLWPHLRAAQLGEVLGDPGEGAMIHLELSGLESSCGEMETGATDMRKQTG